MTVGIHCVHQEQHQLAVSLVLPRPGPGIELCCAVPTGTMSLSAQSSICIIICWVNVEVIKLIINTYGSNIEDEIVLQKKNLLNCVNSVHLKDLFNRLACTQRH